MVLAITPSGQLTVRALDEAPPREGTPVQDGTGRWRGRVVRVFGPVARPYLSVRLRRTPGPAEGAGLIGAVLLRERGTSNATG